MKKCMCCLGICMASLIGAGVIMYTMVLSDRTKREMCQLEDDMCDDLKDMIK